MKISIICMYCQIEGTRDPSDFIYLQVNDQNIYESTCCNGHYNAIVHQHEKFELLFHSAVKAISDGYFREAVSSIAASLERLYEFAAKVICRKNKIQSELFDLAWKQINNQSERQLGAYVFQYISEFKKMPPLLNTKQIEFRNRVIHKGYFPSYEETVTYGQETLNIMFEIILALKENCQGSINEIVSERMIKIGKEAEKISKRPIYVSTPTISSLAVDKSNFNAITLADFLNKVAENKK